MCLKNHWKLCLAKTLASILLLLLTGPIHAQDSAGFLSLPLNATQTARSSWPTQNAQVQPGFFLTGSPAYRLEISRLLLSEANQVAKELALPEKMPISATNIAKLEIYPPRTAKTLQGIGEVVTSNYIYAVSCGYRFSGVQRAHLQQEDTQLKAKYIIPMDQMDTNAAFQLATHFLSLASMDVAALNRDCRVHINEAICQDYEHFTPLYNISWVSRQHPRWGNIASIEVFLPDKSLRQLRVNKSEYILRQPLKITNPDFLNMPTNTPPAGRFGHFLQPPQ
jgi:hypothetical protein